jgi:hypothetical protein
MKQFEALKKQLKPGEVYRRADLLEWTSAVDRHLQQLVREGTLEKLSVGLYYAPRQSVFGKTPADEQELVSTFLKDNRFVVTSPNDYNTLGVGTTHGVFKLGNRSFHFVRRPYVPDKVTKEFLLVDLVNNVKHLEEDQLMVLENVKKKAMEMDKNKLKQLVRDFGTVGTKKQFASLLK